jgi:amino acid transporter
MSSGLDTPDAGGAPGAVEAFGYRQELKRSLSNFDLLVYGLVFIVPGAPISVYGIVFNASAGMVPLVFLVGLVAMLFTAASYVSMSRVFPIAGSVYAYAGRAIGASAGFLAGWVMLLDYLLLPTLVYVLCAVAMHSVVPDIPRVAWIVTFVLFNTVINVMGIETTARMSRYILVIQLVVLAAFMVLAVIAFANGTAGAHFSMTPIFNPTLITPSLIFGALSLAVLSFLGFDAISTLAEEATGGAHAVGRATYLSLIVTASIFVILTYTASLFVLDRTSFPKGDATDAAFYNIAMTVGGYWLKWVLAVPGVIFAGLPGALAAQVATTRLLYSMARDGKLPRALAHVTKRQVPERAALLVSAVSLILGVAMAEHLELLTSMVNFGALVGFLLLHTSVVVYFARRHEVSNRWLHVAAAGIGFAIIGYVLINLHTTALVAGLSWTCVGLIVLGYQKWSGQRIELP